MLILGVTFGVRWLVDQLPTAIDDNPARFYDVDPMTGNFIVAFRTAQEGRKKFTAKLARNSPPLGQNRARAIQLLTQTYYGHFAAYLNKDGELEIIVWDEELDKEISFNDKLRSHLQKQ